MRVTRRGNRAIVMEALRRWLMKQSTSARSAAPRLLEEDASEEDLGEEEALRLARSLSESYRK